MIKIFKIINKLEKKFYIGQTKDVVKRFQEIMRYGRRGYKNKKANVIELNGLYEDMYRLGIENFHFEVIDIATDKKLANIKEKNIILMNIKRMQCYNNNAQKYTTTYKRPLYKLDTNKNILKTYNSTFEVIQDGYLHNKVAAACVKVYGFHKGCLWVYADDFKKLTKGQMGKKCTF